MRDKEIIEEELEATTHDLERTLANLKDIVRGKVDVKAKAQRAYDRSKARAAEGMDRAEYRTSTLVHQSFAMARRRPKTILGVIGGMLVLGIAVVRRRQSLHRRRFRTARA